MQGHTITLCFQPRSNGSQRAPSSPLPPTPSAQPPPSSPIRTIKSSWSELDWDDAPDPPAPPPSRVRPASATVEYQPSWPGKTSPPAVSSPPRVTPRQQLGWSFITNRRRSASDSSGSDTATEVPARRSGPASVQSSDDAASTLSFVTAASATPSPSTSATNVARAPLPPAVIVAIAIATAQAELVEARLDPIAHPAAYARAFARVIGDLTTLDTHWATTLEPIRFRHVGAGSDEELRAVIEAVVGNAERGETVRTLAIERLSDASAPSVAGLVLCCGGLVELVLTSASASARRVLDDLTLRAVVASSPALRRLTLGSLPPTPCELVSAVVGPALRTIRLQDMKITGAGSLDVERLELQGVEGAVLSLIDRVRHLRLDGPVIVTTPADLLAHLRQADEAIALRTVTLGGLTSSSRWRGSATAEVRLLRTIAGRRGVDIVVE